MYLPRPDDFNIDNFYLFFMDLRNDLKVILVHAIMGNEKVYPLINEHEGLFAEISRIMREVEKEKEQVAT